MGDRVFAPVWSWQVTAIIILAFSATVRGGEDALYPYGPAAGDTEIGHIGGRETLVALTTPLKYYGQSFNTAYILNDGMISFEPGVRYLELKWREGAPYPAIDRPFIAPFHYNGYVAVNPQLYPARTYYKLISRSGGSVLTSEDRDFMDRLDTYLMSASVALKSGFYAEFAFKVTWENVSSADSCSESQLQTPEGCPSNTFQVVLVGNNEHTFAIFNYYKMEIPFTEHQLAGLNGGHGRGWTDVVPCTGTCAKRSKLDPSRINSLASRVGSDVEGRYILVINDDVIIRGGCIPSGLKSVEMEVFPRQVGMFGGEMLAVSARCLQPGTKIYCRFGLNDQARSEGVMETTMRGRCPVPILTTRGQVFLEISTDNMAWKYKTQITVVLPSRLQLPIDLSDIQSAWYEISPNDLRLRWKRDLFSGNRYATVEVNLIGYREDAYSNDPVVVRRLAQLATGVLNTDEQHTIDPSQFSCTSECEEFEIGLVQLRVSDQYIDETTKYQSVNVGPVALGWYVKNAMTQRYGNDWAAAKCKAWNDEDRLSAGWLDHLLPCPCTLSQALADWGRWQPDVGCNMFTGSVCKYHIGAKHCVRSVHPSQDGSGNQCCYEQDGNLRYAADTYQGSTPDRSHDWGSVPYGAPDHVPSLSHWTHDVITFYYCCLWVEYRQCNYYMDRRATRDCKAYTPPHSATVYGDPHITTFDGKSYYFGGSGDFWILKSDGLNIQGRFEERENQYLNITPTQLAPTNLTSVVAWINGSDVVTVRKAPSGGPLNRKLDVLVGTQRRFFEDESQMWQDYDRVSILNNARTAKHSVDKHHSNFTVLFAGGAAVQVAERQGLLHLIVVLPPGSGKTQGLLGTMDQDVSNEFETPLGDVIPADSNDDTVYFDFSLKWNVTAAESKFHWPRTVEDTKAPLFGDPQKFPYVDESQKPEEAQVQSVCRQSQSCRRDYYATNDVSVARASKKTAMTFAFLQRSQKRVRSCGHLDIPMSVKTPTVYTEGSVVTVTGCRPDNSPVQSTGPLTYVCNATGSSSSTLQWSPQPDTNLCPHASVTEPVSSCEAVWSSALPASQTMVTHDNYTDPQCGGKQVIVQLFEWKWTDIAKECERFLGPKGFCGVQVSPATEHPTITQPPHPWWQCYQPVSYKLVSRSGDEQQFADMVSRCNAVGVRTYVDVQLNHMTGTERSGTGTAGSKFNGGTLDFPGVPYTSANFNPRSKCPSSDGHIHNYDNAEEVRNCQLLTLADLDQSQAAVRQKQAAFLNRLLELGVAGFRLDSAKYMWPRDLAAIQALLNDTQFGARPFFLHHVIDLGHGAVRATDYTGIGYVTEFRYGASIAHGIQDFGYLQQLNATGMLDSGHALVFVDNHDNQRGHWAGSVLTFNSPHDYMLAQAFTLAWNYGLPRVMSSYRFSNSDEGPPHDANFTTADVTVNADGTCSGGWVCEHRWPAIANMVAFRNHVTGTDVSHFVQHANVVGFTRGSKGFFAMGKRRFDQTFQTGLPAGRYCDLVSNCQQNVTVDGSGRARLAPFSDDVAVVAFLVDGPTTGCPAEGSAGTGGTGGRPADQRAGATADPQNTVDSGTSRWRRTVILIEQRKDPGQDLFIRGGIGPDQRPGCQTDATTSACAIPIRHRAVGRGDYYAKAQAWSKGDNFLDWQGAEPGQGTFGGLPAGGTPAVWTTNDPSHSGYSQFNTFGEHYWLVDVDMDCSGTENGYFEFKVIFGGLEGSVLRGSCTGSRGGAAPYSSTNHVGRCGFLNTYHFGRSICTIEPIQ